MSNRMPRHPRAPFEPGRSVFAYKPDGTFIGCGICGGRLELFVAHPRIEEHNGRWFRAWFYDCADHGGLAGAAFYEPASPEEAAEAEGYKAAEARKMAA